MGYRHTFISDDLPRDIPVVFSIYWSKRGVRFEGDIISSKIEQSCWEKFYKALHELFIGTRDQALIIQLGENGSVTRWRIDSSGYFPEQLSEQIDYL